MNTLIYSKTHIMALKFHGGFETLENNDYNLFGVSFTPLYVSFTMLFPPFHDQHEAKPFGCHYQPRPPLLTDWTQTRRRKRKLEQNKYLKTYTEMDQIQDQTMPQECLDTKLNT